MFEDPVIVAAHPDDEVLWFSSVLANVDQIVLCFLGVDSEEAWTEGRRKSIAEYPLRNLSSLGLAESGVFWAVDWDSISETEYGVAITDRQYSDHTYRRNFALLIESLEGPLKGARNVFTHNPWGEYGHVEHIQVYKAVRALQVQLGFDLWVSNYCSNRTAGLMAQSVPRLCNDRVTLSTDPGLAGQIARLYKDNGCWTWYPDFEWAESETFFKMDANAITSERTESFHPGSVIPFNVVAVEPAREGRPKSDRRVGLRRRIGRMLRRLGGTIGDGRRS